MKTTFTKELATSQNVDLYSFGSLFPDPDSTLASQGRGISLYRELLNDPHVKACTMSRKSGVVCKSWELEGSGANLAIIKDVFAYLDLPKLVGEILNAPLFGYQPIEVVWQVLPKGTLSSNASASQTRGAAEGFIVPSKVEAKPQEWFCFDKENNLRLKSQKSPYEGEIVPEKKFLCPKYNPTYLNPYGEKLLASVFWPVTFKKGGIKFWVSFTEKYGMPWAMGKIPRQTIEAEAIRLRDALENMVQDGVAVFDDNCSVELVESGSKSQSADVYAKLVQFNNEEISKAILGQTLTTQVGDIGSYSAGKVHSDIRDDILSSDVRLVEATINQLIAWICELNYPSSLVPKFVFKDDDTLKADLASRDKLLKDTGVVFTKEYFMRNYGLNETDFELFS